MMGVDDQCSHLKPAEVQDGGAHLGAHAGESFKPRQSRIDRPILQKIQVQTAAPCMDLPKRGRQVQCLSLGKGERSKKRGQVVRCRVADGFPAPIMLN